MSAMDDREKGFESKFAFDEELRFKATARRNKALGLWAAEKLGKSGDDAEAYAKSVVVADLMKAGDDDIIGKVVDDFAAGSVKVTKEQIVESLHGFMAKAIDDLHNN